jgi:hypothetical protein
MNIYLVLLNNINKIDILTSDEKFAVKVRSVEKKLHLLQKFGERVLKIERRKEAMNHCSKPI